MRKSPDSQHIIPHRLNGPWLKGVLLRRYKQFLCDVRLKDGRCVVAHMADRGRLEGIVEPGAQVYVSHQSSEKRKTEYSLVMVDTPNSVDKRGIVRVSVDPAGANRLVRQVIESRILRPFSRWTQIRQEVRHESSRLDFEIVTAKRETHLIEVKSVVAARNGTGLFPDAPSPRALRHLESLRAFAQNGQRATVIFVAQREDIRRIRPHPVDPNFAKALAEVRKSGVGCIGLGFTVTDKGFLYQGRIRVYSS